MFSTSSTAIDPLLVQIKEELDGFEPNILETQKSMAELQNLVPQNLLSQLFKFKVDIDKINKERERMNLFKHRIDQNSLIYDMEQKIKDYINTNTQKSFIDLESELMTMNDEEPEENEKIAYLKNKEKENYNKILSKLANLTNSSYTAKANSNKFEIIPKFFVTKVEKDSEFLNSLINEIKGDIEQCENNLQYSGKFNDKFADNQTVDFAAPIDDDVDASGQRIYKVPDISIPFASAQNDASSTITALNNDVSNLELQFSMVEHRIQNIKSKLQETALNQNDIASVLKTVEDKALEQLSKSDEIQEKINSIDNSPKISNIQDQITSNGTQIKSELKEIRSLVDSLEDIANRDFI